MREWELVPVNPSLDPYQVAVEIRHLITSFEDATEAEVESVAARHGWSIHWLDG